VPDEAALLDHLRTTLADDHITPLAEAVNDATQRPLSALTRSATDRLVAAIVWVGELIGRRDRACELARAVTDGHAELRMLKAGESESLLHVREGCCLYYRVPGGTKCWSCPLLHDDERRALVTGG
jgi:ferric iron reductase protein FhuF